MSFMWQAHNFTDIRQFNLMFKTFQGVTEDAKNTVYLRPETAQGIFVNFKNVAENHQERSFLSVSDRSVSHSEMKLHLVTSFSAISEFEQMELEFFCKPGTDLEWFEYWRSFCHNWLINLGIKEEDIRAKRS